MNIYRLISIAAALVLAEVTTFNAHASDAYYDYATVLSSEPRYRTVRIEIPERECWDEPVTIYQPPGGGYRSTTPMILGGITGAAIGHHLGHGYHGRHLGTVAGGVLGVSVARDMQHSYRRNQPSRSRTRYETRCETRSNWREEERLDGYRVEYKYNGRVYHTVMDRDPGQRFRVNVRVSPAE